MPQLIRINKFLAERKFCARREADRLIAAGKVWVNGKPAYLGQMVRVDDRVEIKAAPKKMTYYLFNKPAGVVTSLPAEGETAIRELLPAALQSLYPVGRLDKASRGLILLTNDGRLTAPLLSPAHYHEKEYEVTVDRKISRRDLETLSGGVSLGAGGVKTRPCLIKRLGDCKFSITLTEGRNRQIRRMCGVLGAAVEDLRRVRIMHLRLGHLAEGQVRALSDTEREKLFQSCGIINHL